MHKVISINLNGNAYQLDEDAYLALSAYLDRAQAALRNNPDRTEILGDLEQAIAAKCSRFLGPQKTVVSKSEIDQIITEMGPVEAGDASTTGDASSGESSENPATAKRLYRVTQGAMFMGVCAGLAAYFRVDVTLVRIVFVIASFATSGVAILL